MSADISTTAEEIETTDGPPGPPRPSLGDGQSRESGSSSSWRKSNVVVTWCYLNAVGFVLFAVAFASSLCNIACSSWVTGIRCSEAELRNGTAEEERSIAVHLWRFCNVHLVDDGISVIKYSNCSVWDAEMIPVWYHGVQLATFCNMLSVTTCLILAGFSWLCCRRNQRRVFISVCISAVCSVLTQSIGLVFFLAGDVSVLFDQLTDSIDGTNCGNYRFSGYGAALVLSTLSLTSSVVAGLLQAPISWMRSILNASSSRTYSRMLSPLSDERTPLLQTTVPSTQSTDDVS